MELGQDWVAFQNTLYPGKKLREPPSALHSQSVLVASKEGRSLRVYADQEELGDLVQENSSEVANHLVDHQYLGVFDSENLDQAIDSAISSGNGLLKQLEILRASLKTTIGKVPEPDQNFLLEATQGWWSRVLPSTYGIYLSLVPLEGMPARSLLLLMKKGVLDQFDEPDLSSLSPERRKELSEVIKYLREKYSTPIQGVSLSQADWEEWCKLKNPWGVVTRGLKSNRVHLVPFRWAVASLVGARGLFRV